MRALLFLFVASYAGMVFSQTGGGGADALAEAGIPALSREWSGDDYQKVSKVLAQGALPLPRLTDEPGRLFLERLTNTENFALLRDRALPLDTRMPGFFKLLMAATDISKLYLDAADKGQDLHREFMMQLAFTLKIAGIGVQLMDEFLPTIPKDQNYEARMAAIQRAHAGLMKMFAGAEGSLSETRLHSPADLSLLLSAMAETLPVLKRTFPADYKLELRKKLESRKAAFPGAEDAKAIQQMIDELGV